MIKLKNTPKQLLNTGFIGIELVCRWDLPGEKSQEVKDWFLSLLSETDYYGEYCGIIFIRMTGIETLARLKYGEVIGKVYRHVNDWPNPRAVGVPNFHKPHQRQMRVVNSSKSTFTRSKISGKKKKHWVKKKYPDQIYYNRYTYEPL